MEEIFEERIEENESIDFSRYFRVLARRWWLIVIITMAVVIPWALYLKHQPPIYEAETWISFEDLGGQNPKNLVQNRTLKLKSRSLTEEVTAELGLTLELLQDKSKPFLERQDVFKKFSTSKNPVSGTYTLHFYPSGYCSLYFGTKLLDSLEVEKFINNTVSYNGFYFSLNPDIVNRRSRVDFVIKNFRRTVRSLISREKIRTNREGNLMSITLRGKNPILVSRTVNRIAGVFVQKSIEIRKENKRFIRNYLQEQLALVRKELDKTDFQLKAFRDKHRVSLDQISKETVAQLNSLSQEINKLTVQKNELDLLVRKLDPSTPDFDENVSASYIYRQIASQPAFEGDADMNVARQEFNDLEQKRQELLINLPKTNPTIVELSDDIQALEQKIYQLAKEKIKELSDQIAEKEKQSKILQKKLNTLPAEELKYIRFTRERKTNEDLYGLLLKRFKEAQISEAVAPENVSILDPAEPPDRPVSGDKKKKLLLGMLLGLFLGVGFVFILEEVDKTVKTREDIVRHLQLPIIGVIPKVKFDSYELQDSEKAKSISSQIVTHDYSPTPVGEAYRALRTNLLFSKSIGTIRSLVIGSAAPGEGKSFTAANLAITLAQQKSKTLLIDADLRRGVLHNSFNCPKKPGLTNYLTGVVSLENVLNDTYIPNLSLITCGSLIPNPSELLGSLKMKKFIEGITQRFDFVIFDTPPLNAATDAVILATFADGVALLVRAGESNREEVKRKLELFRNVQAKIVGVILNCAGVEIAHDGYSYYHY